MFFKRKHLVEFGYKVMGFDTGSNNTCYNYVKYFPEYSSLVVFSTIFDNSVLVYKLTSEQYQDFIEGKFALSHNGKGYGKTPCGYDVKNYGLRTIFGGGEIARLKYLKEMLDVAEEIAQGQEVKFSINFKLNRIKL
jgi:hypothetical protein